MKKEHKLNTSWKSDTKFQPKIKISVSLTLVQGP